MKYIVGSVILIIIFMISPLLLIPILIGSLLFYLIMNVVFVDKSKVNYKKQQKLQNKKGSKIKEIESFGIYYEEVTRFKIIYTSYNNILPIKCKIKLYDKDKNLVKVIEEETSETSKERHRDDDVYVYTFYGEVVLENINIFDDNIAYYSLDEELDNTEKMYSKFYTYSRVLPCDLDNPSYEVNSLNFYEKSYEIIKDKETQNRKVNINDENPYIHMTLKGRHTYTLPTYYCELYKYGVLIDTIEVKGSRFNDFRFNEIIEYRFETNYIDFDKYKIYSNEDYPSVDLTLKNYRYILNQPKTNIIMNTKKEELMIIDYLFFSKNVKGDISSMILTLKGSYDKDEFPDYVLRGYDEGKNVICEVSGDSFNDSSSSLEISMCVYFEFDNLDFKYFDLLTDSYSYPCVNLGEVMTYTEGDFYNKAGMINNDYKIGEQSLVYYRFEV